MIVWAAQVKMLAHSVACPSQSAIISSHRKYVVELDAAHERLINRAIRGCNRKLQADHHFDVVGLSFFGEL